MARELDPARGRRLPLAWLVLAHLCLAAAFAATALAPAAVGGFYYHPRMLAVVHLVTLGWITASILGALYLVVPMALGGRLPAGRADAWALGGFALGATGMASHFWIGELSGMVWSAGLATVAALWVGGRAARAIAATTIPAAVKLHFHLAFLNLVLASVAGVLVGADRLVELLPGASLDHVLGHAHLASLGWATMMVMAAAYRLLPMILPAAPPRGPWVWAGAVVTEIGVLGLSVSLWLGRGPAGLFAALTVAGVAVFLSRVLWMLRHRRPPPRTLERFELSRLHLPAAFLWLIAAAAIGLALAVAPPAEWKLPAALLYGVAGLVGFLSQIVVGVAGRIVPLWLWMAEIGGREHSQRPVSPYALADRRLEAAVLALWTAGVPLLAAGLALDTHPATRAGAACLTLAALAGLGQLGHIRRAARRGAAGAVER